MRVLRRFAELSARERRLVLRAAVALAGAGLAVRFCPGRVLRGLHDRETTSRTGQRRHDPQAIAWAVAAASRYLPGTRSCLIRALAARTLLGREGYTARVHIGVATSVASALRAHAWVESEGQVVLGDGPELASFLRLPLGDNAVPLPVRTDEL